MSKISGNTITQWSLAALLLSQAYLMGGCEEPSQDGDPRAWTGYTSEEYPPLACPDGSAVSGVDCSGGYCDNISLNCNATGRTADQHTWLPYFSEEGSGAADQAQCLGGDTWMTGLACSGGYCDNISLRCSRLVGSSTGECEWLGWYSEEQGPFDLPPGYFLKGIECDGGYCDNKRYLYCGMY